MDAAATSALRQLAGQLYEARVECLALASDNDTPPGLVWELLALEREMRAHAEIIGPASVGL